MIKPLKSQIKFKQEIIHMQTDNKYQNRMAFSVAEVSEILGISEQHIWNSIRIGLIKKTKLGRRTLIHKTELDKLFQQFN